MLNEPSDLGAAGLVAERFAAADAARMAELDRLIKTGKGNDVPPPQHQEEAMPRGKRETPWPCCGSASHRHLKSCAKAGATPAAKVQRLPVKRAKAPTLVRVASSKLFDTQEATVEQLVETIEACRAELADRRVQLQTQLDQVAEALGSAA